MVKKRLITGVVVATAVALAMVFIVGDFGSIKANPKGVVSFTAITKEEVPSVVLEEQLMETVNMEFLTRSPFAFEAVNRKYTGGYRLSDDVIKSILESPTEEAVTKFPQVIPIERKGKGMPKVEEEETEEVTAPVKAESKKTNESKDTKVTETIVEEKATEEEVEEETEVKDKVYDYVAANVLLSYINSERSSLGLCTLTSNDTLTYDSQWRTEQISRKFGHGILDGKTLSVPANECITKIAGANYEESSTLGLQLWESFKSSTPHYITLTADDSDIVGVSVYINDGVYYSTVLTSANNDISNATDDFYENVLEELESDTDIATEDEEVFVEGE